MPSIDIFVNISVYNYAFNKEVFFIFVKKPKKIFLHIFKGNTIGSGIMLRQLFRTKMLNSQPPQTGPIL